MTVRPDITQERRQLGALGDRVWKGSAVVGAVGVAVAVGIASVTTDGWRRFLFAYLLNFSYLLALALGALFFVILQHLTRAGWSVVVRRLAEGVTAVLPFLAVLAVPVVLGLHQLYHWSDAEVVAQDHLLQGKAPYLNGPFFVARLVVYFAIWTILARFFVARSVAQDATGDGEISLLLQRRAAPAMIAFALTTTFAAFDLLMSLDPHWFSTIFGVYFFAGAIVSFVALLIVITRALQGAGFLVHAITVEHYHDLGKLLFAFTVFWAYIAISQFMLIWYANLPEETGWFLRRQTNGWQWIGLALILGHFLVPFAALLGRQPKRNPRMLALAAVWQLAMGWVDVFYLVGPEAEVGHAMPRVVDLALLIGLGGLAVAYAVRMMMRRSLIAERDPRLEESLLFENA